MNDRGLSVIHRVRLDGRTALITGGREGGGERRADQVAGRRMGASQRAGQCRPPGGTATEPTLLGRSKPEWLKTWLDRTLMHRLGEPDEIAAGVLFLASDAASVLTGSILTMGRGCTCW